MLIVDAQVHIWDIDRPDRPWPDPEAVRTNKAVKNHSAHKPIVAEDLIRNMDSAGVDRAILVPPGWDGDKNDLALAAARKYPGRFAIMGRLPIRPPAAANVLQHWRDQPGMLGLRYTFSNQNAAHLTDGTADWLWPAAERAGLPLMVFPPGLVTHFHAIAERHPGLKIVIDHLALAVDNRKDDAAFWDLPELLRLARHPNIAVKASCVTYHAGQPYPHPGLHPYIRQVFDAFGPERVFWGSDFTRLPSYREAVTMFTEELPWLTGRDKELVMGRAVCDWLGWRL